MSIHKFIKNSYRLSKIRFSNERFHINAGSPTPTNNNNSHSVMHSPWHAHNAVHCKAALQHEQFPRQTVLQRQRISTLHVVDTSERVLHNGFQPLQPAGTSEDR